MERQPLEKPKKLLHDADDYICAWIEASTAKAVSNDLETANLFLVVGAHKRVQEALLRLLLVIDDATITKSMKENPK